MGNNGLIIIDLPGIDNEAKDKFYEVLNEEEWTKINHLNTAWKFSFHKDVTRNGAITTLEDDLKKAKKLSNAKRVDYAIQLDEEEIVMNKLVD